jgi:DNA-binding CsgD family transcriptional regulator
VAAVGRDLVRSAEWQRIREFAETVRTAPAALAVQGEAGAGKSTLWRAGIQTAAAALFVSMRTIETHVASIYRKLGVRAPAELARRLPAGPE